MKLLAEDDVTCSTNKLQEVFPAADEGIYRQHLGMQLQQTVFSGPNLHTRQLVEVFRFVGVAVCRCGVNVRRHDGFKRHIVSRVSLMTIGCKMLDDGVGQVRRAHTF